MRASRLLSLLMLLQLRGRSPASALAEELEVSVRTLYRDVEALSEAGIPIYAEQGRNGGIVLQEGFRTRLTGLTRGEAEALPLAGVAWAAQELGLGVEAAAAQLKLMASLPPDAGASAHRIAERFHLDPLPWYHRPESPPCLHALAQALWQDRRIRLDYEAWRGPVSREVGPLGLVLKGGLWYLVALDGRPKTFRVSSIVSIEVLEPTFKRPSRFELARYWPAWLKDFEARLFHGKATVRLTEEGCRILRAVNPIAAQEVEATGRRCRARGWQEAEIHVEDTLAAARQLLRLGAEVEVMAPPELREALVQEAQRILRRHALRR